jgi:hypothetical protein
MTKPKAPTPFTKNIHFEGISTEKDVKYYNVNFSLYPLVNCFTS